MTLAEIVLAGRTRWKVENENNNTLKTKATSNTILDTVNSISRSLLLNILSLLHTLLDLLDQQYKLLRGILPTRKTFF